MGIVSVNRPLVVSSKVGVIVDSVGIFSVVGPLVISSDVEIVESVGIVPRS